MSRLFHFPEEQQQQPVYMEKRDFFAACGYTLKSLLLLAAGGK